MTDKAKVNDEWRRFLAGEEHSAKFAQVLFRPLPSPPRCALCYAPFEGPLKWILKLIGKDPWARNPNVCRFCGHWLMRKGPGGANVELTLLFADIRGSTHLAETLSPTEYVDLINRFYENATESFVRHGAIIDQLVGDEAIGLFLPGFVGTDHSAIAYRAAHELLVATGHGGANQPWAPLGIGIHTGTAYIGSVGSEQNFTEFTAVGDAVNTTARLASKASAGEIVISKASVESSSIDVSAMRSDLLELKGKAEGFPVYVSDTRRA